MPLWLVAPALLAVAFFIMVLGPGRTEGHAAEKPMTDDWKLRYFGNLAVAEEDDPDRDTLSNVFEAEIGTDPTAEDSDKDGNPDWMGIASYLFQEKWQEPDGWPLHAADRRHEFNRPGGMQFFNHGAKADSTGGNAFHQRLRGKLTAPVSGDYEFWIAGDNGCELWLGVDGSRFGARRVAGLPHGNSRTQPDEWEKYPGQKSAKVTLEAGRAYYLEILHRDFRGYDHVSLAWKPPGGVREPVPASALRSLVVDPEDRDDDGMRDAWEIANGLVVGTHDAMEDPDGDGIVNVLEHDAGGDPQDPAAIGGLLSWSRWDWPGTPADAEKFIAAGGPSRDPVHRDALAGFKLPRGTGTGTIDRLYGTLTAPEDGIYSFWLTGKVPAILSLSTDSHAFNKRTIARNAHLRSATNIVWQGNTHSVRSIPVRLKKGEIYFIEALLPSITTYPPFGVSWTRHASDSWSDGGLAEGVSGTWSEQEGSTVARVAGIGGFGGTSGDTMAFRHVEVEGAAEAIGRMGSLTTLPKGSGGGLMLRESPDPFAPFVAVTFDARRKIVFHSRVKPGEPVKSVESTRSLAGTLRLKESLWLRLRADGKECHALWSVDGVTWNDAGKVALKFGERTMAGPVAWGAASKAPVEVKFSDLVVDGLFGSEPVPAKVLATAGPDPEDTDADGLPDAWERQHGIDTAIGKGPDGAGGDPDGDRLSHAREFKLGGDPRKAGGIPGYLSRERWDGIPGSRVSDLVDHLKFRGKPDISDLIPRPDLEGGVDSNYGQRIRGTMLLGTCFLREARETAVGADRRAGKRGLRGERGLKRCFGASVAGVSERKVPIPRRDLAGLGAFGGKIIASKRSLLVRLAKMVFGSGFLAVGRAESELVENQGSAVVQSNLGWLPPGALVEAIGIWIGWIPRTIEPVEVRFVIGDPFLDRQPGRLDRLHGVDVERGRWRARELDQPFPKAMEAEEELDFLAADDLADGF
jgi:hypothetical protein